jgi:hypothetical protein
MIQLVSDSDGPLPSAHIQTFRHEITVLDNTILVVKARTSAVNLCTNIDLCMDELNLYDAELAGSTYFDRHIQHRT